MPYFSVVIPLYNKEKFVAATISSVLMQTFADFELIIVNDVSTDSSLSIAQNFDDSRIRIITHPVNMGLSASRNTGIKNAASEYIAFLDADDLWKPEFLETISLLISKYPEASLFATKYEEVHHGKIVKEIHPAIPMRDDGILNFFSASIGKLPVSFSSICIGKEVFDSVGYFDEKITYAEDIDFYIRANNSYKLAYYNLSLAQYMIHSIHQMSLAGIKGKILTDFDKYESIAKNRLDIKRYLDFNRYFIAKLYRMEGNMAGYKKMIKGIDMKSLNYKQRLLLMLPGSLLKLVSKVKMRLLKRGIVVNSYD
jgi:glycosyltransferase involved in cell wall biosynthesis